MEDKKEYWHLLPTGDTNTHKESINCPCNPTLHKGKEEGKILVVHNAFDGRELYEQADKRLNEEIN